MSTVAAPSTVATVDSGFRPLRVIEVRRDTPDTVVVTFAPPDDEAPWTFRHGQHLVLRRVFDDVELRRTYSLCTVAPDGPLRVGIRLVDGGAFSSWAHTELAVGDIIEALPPGGHFTHDLDPAAARSYLLVAGGSGITPLCSVAATVLATEPRSTVTLLYVNRTTATTMLLDDIEDLRNRHLGRLRVWYSFTREDTALALLDGRLDDGRLAVLVDRHVLPAAPDVTFLCGPAGLVDVVRTFLLGRGTAADTVHVELFGAGEGRTARPAARVVASDETVVATVTARVHGRTTTVDLYAGDTVLEAVERVRPDVPYSCRAGVCATCAARLTSGEVTMETVHGLTPEEVADGLVLTCQARPTGDAAVVVDFDG